MIHTEDALINAIEKELEFARSNYPSFSSAHEGYSILAEEVDELWTHVKVKQKNRDPEEMQKEAIQIAAMAIRFALDVCAIQGGRK